MAAPDGGWGWMAVVAAFLVYVVLGGTERAYGVWYIEILDRYESGSALSESLIGVHCALRLILYPLVSMVYSRVSLRVMGMIGSASLTVCLLICAFTDSFAVLFVVYGIIGGCVAAFANFASQVVIVEYFDKKKSLAYGIATSGSGIGSLVLAPFLSYCFENFSYFETITYLAGVNLHCVVACALCFPVYEADEALVPLIEEDDVQEKSSLLYGSLSSPQKKPKLPRKFKLRKAQGRKLFQMDLLWNPIVILFALGSFTTTMGSFPVLQLVVHFAVTRGQELQAASLMLSGTGLVEAICRAFGGLFLSLSFLNKWIVPIWCCCPAAVSLGALLITFCYTFFEFVPVVLYTAGSNGVINGFSALVLSKIFDWDAFGPAFSLYSNANGLGILCGTYLAGYMKDASGSYVTSYYIMAGLCLGATMIYLMAYFMVKQAKKFKKYRVYISMKSSPSSRV